MVYLTFCKIFGEESGSNFGGGLVVFVIILVLILIFMAFSWLLMHGLFKKKLKLRIMGLFGCHHKTIVLGLPIVYTVYEKELDKHLGLYTLPLLIWYFTSTIIGILISTKLDKWVDNQQKLLEQINEKKDDEKNHK